MTANTSGDYSTPSRCLDGWLATAAAAAKAPMAIHWRGMTLALHVSLLLLVLVLTAEFARRATLAATIFYFQHTVLTMAATILAALAQARALQTCGAISGPITLTALGTVARAEPSTVAASWRATILALLVGPVVLTAVVPLFWLTETPALGAYDTNWGLAARMARRLAIDTTLTTVVAVFSGGRYWVVPLRPYWPYLIH